MTGPATNRTNFLYLFREFGEALDQCTRFAHFAEPGEIGFCVGPSGAGKSRLADVIGERLYGRASSWPNLTTPYIKVIADNPDRGFFSSKELARSMVSELQDPFHTSSTEIARWDLSQSKKDRLIHAVGTIKPKRVSEPELREVVQSLGKQRHLKLIVVDEANMLALTYHHRTPTDYLESLRTLGKKAGARIILFGTMDLLELRGFSAQLDRSVSFIHLDRMRCEDIESQREFLGMLTEMERKWNVAKNILVDESQKMFDWTYGIPGEIDSLLRRAAIKVRTGAEFDWDAVAKGRKSDEEISRMKLEADVVYSVMNDEPLTTTQHEVIHRRRRARMKARRIPALGLA